VKLSHFCTAAAIAEHGSLRAAARNLGVAQPSLTRSLSELEREIGTPLFERRSKGMIATPIGEAFVRRATAILNDVRRAQEEVEQLRGNAVGQLTVGLSIAAHLWLLPKVLEPFRRRFAHVHLNIIEGFYPTLEQHLQNGSIDFYVGPDPGQKLPRVLRKDTLFAGRRAVLCRAKHPLARAQSLRELTDAEWITTSITPTADKELGALFKRYGLSEPEASATQPVGTYAVNMPCALRPVGDGAGAMDDGAFREPRFGGDTSEGGVVCAVDHHRKTSRYAALPSSRLSNRSHRAGRRQYRAELTLRALHRTLRPTAFPRSQNLPGSRISNREWLR
jgi:DNA-binding transcriptional LysR family regulator